MITVDIAYKAIRESDLETLREYLGQKVPMSPDVTGLLNSMVGYAIERDKVDVVEFFLTEVNVPAFTVNNWFVKWSWYIRKNPKIYKLLMDKQDEC